MNSNKLSSTCAILFGAFLLIEGIWGLFSPVVFGALTTNTTHAVIHIFLGVAGLYYGFKSTARYYDLFLGILLLAVGLLWFVSGANEFIVEMLNVNQTVAYLNIVVGALALLAGMVSGRSRGSSVAILF